MAGYFSEIVRLQDEYTKASNGAFAAVPDGPEWVAKMAAESRYFAFCDEAAKDLEVLLRVGGQRPRTFAEITRAVAREILDAMDFDAVTTQANHASKKVQELRHEADALRNEVKALRAQVDRLIYRNEHKAA